MRQHYSSLTNKSLRGMPGYTLIELVVVLVLIGVLSAYASSRFASTSDYSARVLNDQLLVSLRLAQQTAMGRTASQVSLTIAPDSVGAGQWQFILADGHASFATQADNNHSHIYASTDLNAPCDSLVEVTASTPLKIVFDGHGDRLPATNLRLCIDTDGASAPQALCIAASGYAYKGACVL